MDVNTTQNGMFCFPLLAVHFLCLVIREFLLQTMKYFMRFNYVPESLYRLNFP